MQNKNPKISVILPVYNAETTIEVAIKSILAQTYRDFEFLILDDGSTDNTPHLIRKFKDSRIKIYRQKNAGVVRSLNRLIHLARTDLLARQDSDDVSHPERLQKQFQFMIQNPSYGMVGTQAFIFKDGLKTNRVLKHPTSNNDLQYALNFNNPFVHSSVLIKKSAILDCGGYKNFNKNFFPEDYELWSRIADKYLIANLNEFLVDYHEINESLSRKNLEILNENVILIAAQKIWAAQKLSLSNKTIINFSKLMTLVFNFNNEFKYFHGLKILKNLHIKFNPALLCTLTSFIRYHKVYFIYYFYKNRKFFCLTEDYFSRENLINLPLSPKVMLKFSFNKIKYFLNMLYLKFILNLYSKPSYILDKSDTSKIHLFVIAYNNPSLIYNQIILVNKFLVKDEYIYNVIDNSSDNLAKKEIENICLGKGINYISVPNHFLTNPSHSHGFALNFTYKTIIQRLNINFFGFLDHDIFPTKKTSLLSKVNKNAIYSLTQLRFDKKIYPWPGFCFFNAKLLPIRDLNFLPSVKFHCDTGGLNVFDKKYFNEAMSKNISFVKHDLSAKVQNTSYELIDDWIHFYNGSFWAGMCKEKVKMQNKLLMKLKLG